MESAFRDTFPDGLTTDFRVIETLGYAPGDGVRRLDRHLDRMAQGCARFGIAFDREQAAHLLAGVSGPRPLRLRLTVAPDGTITLQQAGLPPARHGWRVAIAPDTVWSGDPWLRVKTTQRALYDQWRAALPAGVDEMLFCNETGALCEGTITTLFVETEDGLLTPPLSCGVLPGVLRQDLLDTGRAHEAVLHPRDLHHAQAVWLGNSLRGLFRAEPA